MFMTSDDFRESLRRYNPRVFCDGDRIESVADEPRSTKAGSPPGQAVVRERAVATEALR